MNECVPTYLAHYSHVTFMADWKQGHILTCQNVSHCLYQKSCFTDTLHNLGINECMEKKNKMQLNFFFAILSNLGTILIHGGLLILVTSPHVRASPNTNRKLWNTDKDMDTDALTLIIIWKMEEIEYNYICQWRCYTKNKNYIDKIAFQNIAKELQSLSSTLKREIEEGKAQKSNYQF